jgi:hypothetical protein
LIRLLNEFWESLEIVKHGSRQDTVDRRQNETSEQST